jgi:DNA-nicking Smr family endonuclease
VNRKPDEDDTQLFREAVRDVKPLAQEAPVPELTRRPAPRARFTRSDHLALLKESLHGDLADPQLGSGEELVFAREGVQHTVLKKLRRGQFRVQAEIDLHGMTLPEAKQELRAFLAHALEQHIRCVRVIHGKGLRSGNRGPVLKSAVSAALRRIEPVLAYVSARQGDGGTGAVYVLLAAWPLRTKG